MKKAATIILNRNLPEPTNRLVEHLNEFDSEHTDVFVVEAGSDEALLSQYSTWHVNTKEVQKHGLRYSRGMNYGLLQLWKENKWEEYSAFFLLTNDTELSNQETVKTLLLLLDEHPKAGIISPCSKRWGERFLLKNEPTKYFWFIHNNTYFLSRRFIDTIKETDSPNYMNFLFDGENFRGYLSESELIAKAYANDWVAAITTKVFAEENESYLLEKQDLIKTESYEENIQLYFEEGLHWLKRKYGFTSRWSMQQYVKLFYDQFFEFHPEYKKYKI
ncbi:MAG: hypothetical protein CMG52_03235 [Candidatus Marinimicrobia bacterium]|jgi:hypothetical protein|nr:hypothetical protein [Candidatus Neomarinimicrobiota bacterium]|tara:strand:+ start:105 stop:929 length:825 start_codon:yes stop_codon:yes gene_type:complete